MAPSLLSNDETVAARFEAVALPFMDALYQQGLSLTQKPQDASDLVQETYLRAYRTFSNFTEGTNCKAWLFTILYSIFVNQYRKGQREPDLVSVEEQAEQFHQVLASGVSEPDFRGSASSETDWQEPEIRDALGRLPEGFRSAILLVDVEGLSYEEAAGALDCPVGTLRSRLFRARKILFLELRNYAEQTGIIKGSRT